MKAVINHPARPSTLAAGVGNAVCSIGRRECRLRNKAILQRHFNGLRSASPARLSAFSLIELMIGIIILGIGMIMIASMYPVAWNRARELSEFTTQRAATDNIHALLQTTGKISRPSANGDPIADASGFLGDLMLDRLNEVPVSICDPRDYVPGGDTWAHALNSENIRVADRAFVGEQPWQLESAGGATGALGLLAEDLNPQLVQSSFFCPQLALTDRVYPPMKPRLNVDQSGSNCALRRFLGDDNRWDSELDTRRFFVGVLHRMRNRLPLSLDNPSTPTSDEFLVSAESALTSIRMFDVYYVTLNRPRPTNRYARQAAESGALPDPCTLDGTVAVPKPAPVEQDVMFPTPWRVQMEFPGLSPDDPALRLKCRVCASGIPTEVHVPPRRSSAPAPVKAMIADMFPPGTEFVDEASGEIFRVARVRRSGAELEQAVLTLDREVFAEDLDIPFGDLRCELCNSAAQVCEDLNTDCAQKHQNLVVDAADVIRTVWVYPPPVSPTRPSAQTVAFDGPTPVVGIDVMTLTLTP